MELVPSRHDGAAEGAQKINLASECIYVLNI